MLKLDNESSLMDASSLAVPYPWQHEAWQSLYQQLQNGHLPHALLLSGPEYVGKQKFAKALAQLVLCQARMGGYACGSCKTCKLIAVGSHPDLLQIEPEESGKAIKIDQVRLVGHFVSTTAQQGAWKVVLVSPAEAMNVNAANALLKSLEEPSGNTLLILVSHQSSLLPATVRSRTRIVPFAVPPGGAALSWLQQVATTKETPEWLLAEADGKPLLALKLIESDLLEQKSVFMALLDDVARGDLSPIVAAERCHKLDAAERLDWLLRCVSKDIKAASSGTANQRKFIYLDRILAVKREIQSSSNPNLQLLWESILMDWQAVSGR